MSYENCIKPIIEVLTLGGVFAALIYQNKTIVEQRKEFKRQKIKDDIQQFENSFFHLLNEYNLLTDKYDGLCNIKYPKQSFLDLLDIEFKTNEIEGLKKSLSTIINMEEYRAGVILPLNISNQIFPKNSTTFYDTLGFSYINFLIVFFNIIDRSSIYESNKKNIQFSKRYIDILKSKFSLYENYYLFFYALSENGGELKDYIEKYTIFQNVKFPKCFTPLKEKFNQSAFE